VNELIERIRRDGRNLGNGILKVDGFINHQVDPALMDACGKELAARFAGLGATKVLTAEISGIAPALMTARYLGLPVVYARKTKPITMPDQVFLTLAPSHTKGRMVELIISPEYLAGHEKVLIIDDFLASGAARPPGADGRGYCGRRGSPDREEVRGRARTAAAARHTGRVAGMHHLHG
jgi:xanthine phosphoribosyltransferase